MHNSIKEHASDDGTMLKLTMHKLNSLGFVGGECGVKNNLERLKCMKNQLQMVNVITDVRRDQKLEENKNSMDLKKKCIEEDPNEAKNHIDSN